MAQRRDTFVSPSAHGGYKLECCPLVVDPLTFVGLLGFVAAATAFLNTVITMNIMMAVVKRSRKRSMTQVHLWDKIGNIVTQGKVF